MKLNFNHVKCDCYWNMCKKNAERSLTQLYVISILVSHFSDKLDCLGLLKWSSKILFYMQTFMSGYPGCSPYQLATVGLIVVSFQYHDHQTYFQCLSILMQCSSLTTDNGINPICITICIENGQYSSYVLQ